MAKEKRTTKVHLVMPSVIVHGDIKEGFDIIGPFENYEAALRFTELSSFSHPILIMGLSSPILSARS